MITRLTGILEQVGQTSVVVEAAGGIAYEVWVPSYLVLDLERRVGEPVTLRTIQLFEPVGGGSSLRPRLIGFVSESDRRFYELFTTVKGVGGKRALRAMAVPASRLASAIENDDAAALRALPEIGKRLAETVIAELSGKVGEFLLDEGAGALTETKVMVADDSAVQAIEALVRLGQQRGEAERAVARAVERLADSASADEILAEAFAGSS